MLQALNDGLGAADVHRDFVPKLVGSLVILLIGWLNRQKGVSKAVQLLLTRTGFSKLIDKSGLGAMMSRASFDRDRVDRELVYYFIPADGVAVALRAFRHPNPVSQLLNQVSPSCRGSGLAIVGLVVVRGRDQAKGRQRPFKSPSANRFRTRRCWARLCQVSCGLGIHRRT